MGKSIAISNYSSYSVMMKDSLEELGHQVHFLWNFGERWRTGDLKMADTIIIQWPEALLTARERYNSCEKTLEDVRELLKKIHKKARLLYVSHNSAPIDSINPVFERSLYQLVLDEVDVILHHSLYGQHKIMEFYSVPEHVQHNILRHPVYRPVSFQTKSLCRCVLGINDKRIWLLSIGNIAPYKGHDRMIKYLKRTKNKRLGLAIIGQVYDKDYARVILNSVNELAKGGMEVLVKFEWLSEEQLALWAHAADAILFFHDQDHLTSGLPHLAEGYETPLVGVHNHYTAEILPDAKYLLGTEQCSSLPALLDSLDEKGIIAESKAYRKTKNSSLDNYGRRLVRYLLN